MIAILLIVLILVSLVFCIIGIIAFPNNWLIIVPTIVDLLILIYVIVGAHTAFENNKEVESLRHDVAMQKQYLRMLEKHAGLDLDKIIAEQELEEKKNLSVNKLPCGSPVKLVVDKIGEDKGGQEILFPAGSKGIIAAIIGDEITVSIEFDNKKVFLLCSQDDLENGYNI